MEALLITFNNGVFSPLLYDSKTNKMLVIINRMCLENDCELILNIEDFELLKLTYNKENKLYNGPGIYNNKCEKTNYIKANDVIAYFTRKYSEIGEMSDAKSTQININKSLQFFN